MNLDFEDKFRTIIMKMEKAGNEYAELRGQSYQLQELKGSVLASIISKLGEIPVSRGELLGKSSEEYQNHIKETSQAIKKELIAKCQYEKWKSSFEALRSLISLEKATQNQIGH